ncbi:MAG: peroxiredoxin [Pseudomonadota bacterium]|nr:peroxiredoxin [Pseudomonadota bacterium]
MKLKVLGLLSLMLAVTPSFAALKKGDTAPDFKTQASLAGKEFTFSLRDALKKGPVVVYFYPAAFTGGCNLQAHTFAENHDKFAAAGASVIGVSLDNISRLNDFSADPKYCAGKLPVASDETGEIAKSYDIQIAETYKGQAVATMKDSRGNEIGHSMAERTTFVVASDGKIVATIGGLGGDANAEQALAVVQQLATKRTARN